MYWVQLSPLCSALQTAAQQASDSGHSGLDRRRAMLPAQAVQVRCRRGGRGRVVGTNRLCP